MIYWPQVGHVLQLLGKKDLALVHGLELYIWQELAHQLYNLGEIMPFFCENRSMGDV